MHAVSPTQLMGDCRRSHAIFWHILRVWEGIALKLTLYYILAGGDEFGKRTSVLRDCLRYYEISSCHTSSCFYMLLKQTRHVYSVCFREERNSGKQGKISHIQASILSRLASYVIFHQHHRLLDVIDRNRSNVQSPVKQAGVLRKKHRWFSISYKQAREILRELDSSWYLATATPDNSGRDWQEQVKGSIATKVVLWETQGHSLIGY